VIGRSFWPAAVDVDEEVIDSLGRTGLVSDSPESAIRGMREFAFKHSLTRDVVYSTLPRPERRQLHRQVAEWIQEVARDRDVEAAELAAYHYGQALAYGEDDPEVTRRAVEALLTAGEAAYSRADMEAARAHVERALRFADNDSRPFAQLALTRLHYVDGQFVRALEELEAIEAQLDPDDAQLRSDMLAWRSRTCWLTGRWDEAFSSANEAVVALDGLPESLQLARALARRSQIEMLKHHDDAIPHAKEAIAVARRVDDVFAEVNARINLLSEQATLGIAPDPDDLIDIVDRAVEAGTYDEAYRAIVNFQWSAHGYIPLDETERVIAEARRHLADVPAPVSMAAYVELSTAAKLMLPTGRWAKVDDVSGSAYGLTLTAATSRLVWLMVAAGQAMRRGDLEAAAPLIEELQPAALASGEAQRIVPMACVVLPWLFLTNRSDELRWLADEVLTRLDGRWSAVLPAVPIVRALAAAGEPELLQRTIDSMGRTMKEAQVAKLGIALTAGEGVLALLEGRAADAVEPLRAAVKAERDLGFVYDAACLELDLARAFEAQGRTDEADEARKRAASVLEPLGVVNAF
jgi:tetratricopeptide (TPR) repeat protein